MAEVARGHVSDRPFARTVYLVAARRFSGDFTLTAGGRRITVTWREGRVIGARSRLPADTLVRIAVDSGAVPRSKLAEIQRRLSAGADEPAALAAAGASAETLAGLELRALAQRSARLFAYRDAAFALDDTPSAGAPSSSLSLLDARWVILRGLLVHYDLGRLEAELAGADARAFKLAADAQPVLPAFRFSEADAPLLRVLAQRFATIADLATACPALDRRRLLAVVYALVATDCLEVTTAGAAAAKTAAAKTAAAKTAAARTAAADRKPTTGAERRGRGNGTAQPARPPDRSRVAAVRALIRDKLAAIDGNADHFALLGVGRDAGDHAIRRAYFGLAKKLHPDRLRALSITDIDSDAQRVFAAVNEAFAVVGNAAGRREYGRSLAAGGAADRERADERAAKILAAEEAFRKGERALRADQFAAAAREFSRAVELNPDEGEHHALAAWTAWCNASDKEAVRPAAIAQADRALSMAPKNPTVLYYRGELAAQTGDEDKALTCFRALAGMQLGPRRRELRDRAELEIRLIEKRRGKGHGILDRFRRR